MTLDPFSLAHTTLSQAILASPRVKKYVRSSNYEDHLRAKGGVMPDVRTESNLPWLDIYPTGGPCTLNRASNLITWDYGFQIGIISGDQRFSQELYPAMFAIFAACTDQQRTSDSTLRMLEWQDNRLVRDIDINNIAVGLYTPVNLDGQQAVKGCTSVCTLTLYMQASQMSLVTWANSQT